MTWCECNTKFNYKHMQISFYFYFILIAQTNCVLDQTCRALLYLKKERKLEKIDSSHCGFAMFSR